METILDLLTDNQLLNLETKVWRKITENSGYQPFGYDERTLRQTKPNELKALLAIRKERSERKV